MPTPRHGYTLNGKRVPGVTTVIGRYKDPSGLNGWIWKCGRDGIDYKRAGRDAANIGTAVHDAIERTIKGEDQVPNPTEHYELPFGGLTKAKKCFEAWKRWNEKTSPDYKSLEPQLVHPECGYGGTIDAVADIDGSRYILDWKTSNGIYDETVMQVAAYAELWQENEGDEIAGAYVLRMDKKGGYWEQYKMLDLAGYYGHFLRLLEIWNKGKELFPPPWEKIKE